MLSAVERHHFIRNMQLAESSYDLAIIGGGISGAGVARDAASRGMKVALIEANDFASGTSSRSSKLIHGGIRYLENMQFQLVFEALSERQRLFELAPHLVHPLRFLLPLYKSGRVPAWKMGIGMWLYDALSLFEAPEMNQFLNAQEVEREHPYLQAQNLRGAFTYYDAYMDDDRLVLETLRSARTFGAEMVNFVRAVGAQLHSGRLSAIECEDVLTQKKFTIKARHFVSTVGPWTDRLGQHMLPNWQRTLRPSKGVHLTFSRQRFPLRDAVVMGAESRIVFAIPRHEMVIVGTTDTDYTGDPGQVRTETEDVRYLLQVVDQYFPGAQLTRQDIVGCYAGVRPLIDDGAPSESKTSREHAIWTDPSGLTFVAGGKYTTYRKISEQTVEEILSHFAIEERVRFRASRTLEPLNPQVTETLLARAYVECERWSAHWHIPMSICKSVVARHGLEAEQIFRKALPLFNKCASWEEWMWCAEAMHAVEQTMCLTLADFYFRRTHLVLMRSDHGLPMAQAIAQTMGDLLGWDQRRQNEEINALQNQLRWELSATISS